MNRIENRRFLAGGFFNLFFERTAEKKAGFLKFEKSTEIPLDLFSF